MPVYAAFMHIIVDEPEVSDDVSAYERLLTRTNPIVLYFKMFPLAFPLNACHRVEKNNVGHNQTDVTHFAQSR